MCIPYRAWSILNYTYLIVWPVAFSTWYHSESGWVPLSEWPLGAPPSRLVYAHHHSGPCCVYVYGPEWSRSALMNRN